MKKGFTLIELLAVIVILAIIALIATPIILGIIKDARESANQRSAELYLEAVKLSVARHSLSGGVTTNNLTCTVNSNGTLTCNETEIEVDVTQKATGGTITFTNGMITNVEDLAIGERTYELSNGVLVATGSATPLVSYTITVNITNGTYTGDTSINENGNATVTLTPSENYELPSEITVTGATSNYNSTTGAITLSNPTGNVSISVTCTAPVSYVCTKQGTASQTIGAEYACSLDTDRTFYVLKVNTDTIDLIMDRNYTDSNVPVTVAWCQSGSSNTCTPNITRYVTYIQTAFGSNVTVSIPTKAQIEAAYTGSMPTWLYDYLEDTTHPVSDVYGYWTASPLAGYSDDAWFVYCDGDLYFNVVSSDDYGVRPVITISKSLMN